MKKYEKNNKIEFTPPDGNFDLMTYTIKTKLQPLFTASLDVVKFNNSFGEFVLTLTSNFKSKTIANSVKVSVPVPCDATDFTF